MRYVFVTPHGIIDSRTGETLDTERHLERVLCERPGGVIAGNNLYPVLSRIVPMVRSDHGWSAQLKLQQKRKPKTGRVGGVIYFTHLSYRFANERKHGKRFRPGAVKWLVLNLELFCETDDVAGAAKALVSLADRRGIKPRYSPGSFGGALLRASSQWEKGRSPAPWFISEKARNHLPGNMYALRYGYRMRTIPRAYYLDQKSSHHTIASTIPLPHPAYLRARGRLRQVEAGKHPPWIKGDNVKTFLSRHIGLLCARVECDYIPPTQQHLYPPWCSKRGQRDLWIWTPELRLFDRRIRLRWITAALTSYKLDPVLLEYAEWALSQLERSDKHPAIKAALLASYGVLAVKSFGDVERYSLSGRPKPPRAEIVTLPLVGDSYRSTVAHTRVSAVQNVIARGVIESETRTRSIEYARELESQGIKVSQIYADGIIAITDHMPFLPKYWRVAGELTDVHSPSPNTIFSREMTRTPGIPSGRRETRIEQTSRELDVSVLVADT